MNDESNRMDMVTDSPGDGPESRRVFLHAGLLAAVSLLLPGCASSGRSRDVTMPGVPWEKGVSDRGASSDYDFERSEPSETPSRRTQRQRRTTSSSNVLSRREWAGGDPIPSRMDRMTPVNRITVHHDGMDPNWSTSRRDCAARIDLIRRAHQNRHWGDIGYHYVIDRSGRVWEGRPLRYQGAHVKHHNEGNIGVMCLGNFERQSPSRAQLRALTEHLQRLMAEHNVPRSRVYTHQELGVTACPGRALQRYMVEARRNGALA